MSDVQIIDNIINVLNHNPEKVTATMAISLVDEIERLHNALNLINKYDSELQQALECFGSDSQMLMCIEECAELIHEITKSFRGRESNIAEEVADVLLMARQISLIVGEEKVNQYMDLKIERLSARLEESSCIRKSL